MFVSTARVLWTESVMKHQVVQEAYRIKIGYTSSDAEENVVRRWMRLFSSGGDSRYLRNASRGSTSNHNNGRGKGLGGRFLRSIP